MLTKDREKVVDNDEKKMDSRKRRIVERYGKDPGARKPRTINELYKLRYQKKIR